MSLTPAQVKAAMIPLVQGLLAGGTLVEAFDGVAVDTGQLMVRAPSGVVLAVTMPITLAVLAPLDAFVADAQSRIREVLRPFSGDYRRGFDDQRGALPVQEPGYSAREGV